MAHFFITCEKPDKVKQFFNDMAKKAEKNGYTFNINQWAWQYKEKDNTFFIRFRLAPSWLGLNEFFYLLFKLSLRLRYKEKCSKLPNVYGIMKFLELE